MRYLASPAQLRAGLLRWCLFTVPAIVALGFLSGRVAGSGPGNPWFDALIKPDIYPPPATFGIVWTVLYVMIGVAFAMILAARGAAGRGPAIAVFVVQLALNLAWTPLFFGAHQSVAAFWLLVALIVMVAITIALFARVRPLAAWLLAPYLAWCCFAAVLNWQIVDLNPGVDGREAPGAAVRIKL